MEEVGRRRVRVLVVDGDVRLRDGIRRALASREGLEDFDVQLREAASWADAIQLSRRALQESALYEVLLLNSSLCLEQGGPDSSSNDFSAAGLVPYGGASGEVERKVSASTNRGGKARVSV